MFEYVDDMERQKLENISKQRNVSRSDLEKNPNPYKRNYPFIHMESRRLENKSRGRKDIGIPKFRTRNGSSLEAERSYN